MEGKRVRYDHSPEGRAAKKRERDRWKKTPGGIASRRRSSAKWKRLNKEKRHAHRAVERAVKSGKITRPESCSRCNCTGVVIEGHHADYSKKLDVVWLCKDCHRAEHGLVEA